MNPFETEAMADLFMRQGHRAEALAIYRRLLNRSADPTARERIERRLIAVAAERPAGGAAFPSVVPAMVREPADAGAGERDGGVEVVDEPLGVPAVRARWVGDVVTVEWNLSPRTVAPRVEILLVTRGPAGVATETRTIDVDREAGRITLTVNGLHLARAAAGYRANGAFVPVARG